MQSLQGGRQTDQAPLAGRRALVERRELPKAQHFLDNPDHRLERSEQQNLDEQLLRSARKVLRKVARVS